MGILIQGSKEKDKGEGERKPLGEARPPKLLNTAPFGLVSSCLYPCPFCSRLGSCIFATSILTPSEHMQ